MFRWRRARALRAEAGALWWRLASAAEAAEAAEAAAAAAAAAS